MASSYFGHRDNKQRKVQRKEQLGDLFISYANQGRLSQDWLKDIFKHLGAAMPHKPAEEVMNVGDKSKDNFISIADELELKCLVEYAYNNNNFWDSI